MFVENVCCGHEGCCTLLREVYQFQVPPVTKQLRRKSYRWIHCHNSKWFGMPLSFVIVAVNLETLSRDLIRTKYLAQYAVTSESHVFRQSYG